MPEQFISEAIKPVAGAFDAGRMSIGEPGVPSAFVWRGHTVKVGRVLKSWHTTGPCKHGSGEMYVRRHHYEVEYKISEHRTHTGGPISPRRGPIGRRKDDSKSSSPGSDVMPSGAEQQPSAEGIMRIYFDRQPTKGRPKAPRWWLFSIQKN